MRKIEEDTWLITLLQNMKDNSSFMVDSILDEFL